MPANGPTIRGHPGPHITRSGLVYNPESRIYVRETEYTGSQQGVAGLANVFKGQNREHRLDYENGLSKVTVYDPVSGPPELDKYEISWEMEQRELWNHPHIAAAAKAYDDALANPGDQTFRAIAEDAVDGKLGISPVGVMAEVIAYLRAGLTHWEQEYIVLRRTRVVPPSVGVPCNIFAASQVYTTAQLLLPTSVLFHVPSDAEIAAFPNPNSDYFHWGWRRRPSTSTIQGQANEQTSEFLLAAWPLIYEAATSNADW